MKHLLNAIACCLVVACFGQGTTIHEYPWNPDWDNDNFVGSSDLTGFLSAFGSEFGNPPEPCDYDGTELEEFAAGWLSGNIIVDSLFFEYQVEDISSYYLPGCPDLVTDTIVVSNSHMLFNSWEGSINDGGNNQVFRINFQAGSGFYSFFLQDNSLDPFVDDGFFDWSGTFTSGFILPFPETWYIDEDGIHLEFVSGFAQYANYIHILPYWHYAE